MSGLDGYIVVTADGHIKSKKTGQFTRKYDTTAFYLRQRSAVNAARAPGDAVVRVHVDLEQEPVFIRERRL